MKGNTGFCKVMLALALALVLVACPTDNEESTTYTVSFSPGEGGGTAPANQTVEAGTSITLPNQGGMTAPDGKPDFAGWKTGETTKQAGDSFTVNGDTVFTAQWGSGSSNGDPNNPNGDPSNVYAGFYNYPTGRVDETGNLQVGNSIAEETLIFNGSVDKDNYLGTISSLGTVKLKLPTEQFYSIIALTKSNYEQRKNQATQFSVFTYYSNTQSYSITVSPSSSYGGGTWVFNNGTSFWVEIKKADLTQNHAVIAPNAQRVSIPIAINTPYDYYVYFSKELRYNDKVVAKVDTTDISQANTAQASAEHPIYTTSITPANVSNSVKPAVMLKNNSTRSVRVYYGTQQKTNGGNDLSVTGGESQLISGFAINDNTNTIEFNALAWGTNNKKVPVDMLMVANKVYEITIPSNEDASGITVTEVEASKYYE